MASRMNEVIAELIGMYRSEICLWNKKHQDYHNRIKRQAAMEKLAKKFAEVEPGATPKTTQLKINNLRAAHRKEKLKVEASMKSGASADDVYKPNLWYFDLFDFLADQDIPRISHSNDDDDEVNKTLLLFS
ncbi:hypothetical protein M8J76_014590 [Diaphorina citri]|nr:hypothetical protein M8J75_013665 [Diaphorina citri]KAI5722841.1 hypothetical protein M8J76_014590 [Diaphorina citri]